MDHDSADNSIFSALLPSVPPYIATIRPGHVSVTDLVARNRHFQGLYIGIGQRFARPVNSRLKGQLARWGLSIAYMGFLNAVMTVIKTKQGCWPPEIMRSAFLDHFSIYDYIRFNGLTAPDVYYPSGAPHSTLAGEAFRKLMSGINCCQAATCNVIIEEDGSDDDELTDEEESRGFDRVYDPYRGHIILLHIKESPEDIYDETDDEDMMHDGTCRTESLLNQITAQAQFNMVPELNLIILRTLALGNKPADFIDTVETLLEGQAQGLQQTDPLDLAKFGTYKTLFHKLKNALLDKALRDNWATLYGNNPHGSNSYKVLHCRNWCMAFTGPFRDNVICEHCSAEKDPKYFYFYFSIRAFLRKMISDPDMAAVLFKVKTADDPSASVSDFWVSDLYRHLKSTTVKNTHSTRGTMQTENRYFSGTHELALALYVDGNSLAWRSKFSPAEFMTLAVTILNLPRLTRNQDRSIFMPFSFLKPPDALASPWTSDHGSFLTPLIDDLAEMGGAGFKAVDGRTGKQETVRAHLVSVSGDVAGLSYAMGFNSTHSSRPCRMCETEGSLGGMSIQKYNQTGRLRTQHVYQSYPWATLETSKHPLHFKAKAAGNPPLPAATATEFDTFTHRSLFELNLGSVMMPFCAPVDFMHLISHHTARAMFGFLAGTYLGPDIIVKPHERYGDTLGLLIRAVQGLDGLPAALGGGSFSHGVFMGETGMPPAAWRTVMQVFPLFWWTCFVYNNRPVSNGGSGTAAEAARAYYAADMGRSSESLDRIALMTEMAVILRIIELPSLPRSSLGHLQHACAAFQLQLEQYLAGAGPAAQQSVFSLPLHSLQHLAATLAACGMATEYWGHPIRRKTKKMKAYQYESVDLASKLCLRAMTQVAFEGHESAAKPRPLVTALGPVPAVTPPGVDPFYGSLGDIMAAVAERCVKHGVYLTRQTDHRVTTMQGFEIVNESGLEFRVERGSVVKFYGDDASITVNSSIGSGIPSHSGSVCLYGKCIALVTATIAIESNTDTGIAINTSGSSRLITLNLAVLEVLDSFPLQLISRLWFDPGALVPLTIGHLVNLHPHPQHHQSLPQHTQRRVVVDAALLKSVCYTVPVTDHRGQPCLYFEYLYDPSPLTIDEVLRPAGAAGIQVAA